MKIDLARDLGLVFNYSKEPEWTQDCVAETTIKDGIVVSEDRSGKMHYVKIMEILAVNFNILTLKEQDLLVKRYANLIKTGPENFHIKVITEKANLEEYVGLARAAYEKEENEECKSLIANYINFLMNEGGLESFKTRYFFIFELSQEDLGSAKTESEIFELLKRKSEDVRSSFKSVGNDVIVLDPGEETKYVGEILYKYYNRRTKEYEPYKNRAERIKKDRNKVNELLPNSNIEMDFKSIIAPKSIDFCESPSYMVIDGMYRSHYFVRGATMPGYMSTTGGWLSSLNSFGYGYDIDIFFTKADAAQKLAAIKTGLKISKYNLSNTEEEQENAEEIANKYSGQMYLKNALKGGREAVYDISVLITVWAYTLEELAERKKALKKATSTIDLDVYECKRFQEEAFYSTGYTTEIRPKLFNLTKRNLTRAGVAASYPYTSYSLADKNGIAVGYHRENGSLVMYDQLDGDKYSNGNMFICGGSGKGKTFTLLTLTSRYRYHGTQSFILAPDKQDEFRRICEAVGGQFIDIAATSKQRINPLEIRPMSSPEAAFLGGASYSEKSWVVDKIDNLKVWLSYLIPDISVAEKSILESALFELYEEFGMNEDNDSIYADEKHTKLKKMPIISDFYDKVVALVKSGDLRRDIADILSKFITGACRNMNGETNVDLENKYLVFGLENMKGEMLAPTMFIILEFIWAKCRQSRTSRKMIVIDEGWQLLDGSNEQVGVFVQEIFKLIRGFGGGAIFATQSISDLFSGQNHFGNAILANSVSKIILGMESSELNSIKDMLGLNSEELLQVPSLERGEAMFCAGANHVPVRIKASDAEYTLFTTKREDLEKMLQEQIDREASNG